MTLHHGDCLDAMAAMEPESVDAIVTDPPYDLSDSSSFRLGSHPGGSANRNQTRGFMGKAWDGTGIAFRAETWAACLRVAKPGAYLLAFGGTRTVHRMTVAIEDAGWIIRDMLVWAYASGFPKSKASLKPAWEPIVMARKPGPLRELAIDVCRIGMAGEDQTAYEAKQRSFAGSQNTEGYGGFIPHTMPHERMNGGGRWPANVILTDPIFDGGYEGVVGGGETGQASDRVRHNGAFQSVAKGAETARDSFGFADTGTYSRFFLVPKADRTDREPVLGGLAEVATYPYNSDGRDMTNPRNHIGAGEEARLARGEPAVRPRANVHPTVKPTELMRHLVRLVTPTGGIVLDPFLGSGSTALAAEQEGFAWIGIEKEAEYVAIAEARLNGVQTGMAL